MAKKKVGLEITRLRRTTIPGAYPNLAEAVYVTLCSQLAIMEYLSANVPPIIQSTRTDLAIQIRETEDMIKRMEKK